MAIGIDPVVAVRGANFIFGYVSGGETFASDQFGTGMFSHSPDTGNGGTDDIIEYAGTEGTVFEFSIPLDSGDNMDKPLVLGGPTRAGWQGATRITLPQSTATRARSP